MASNHGKSAQVTVVLGDEYDDALRTKVIDVLRQLGATSMGQADRFVAGSQELEELDVAIDGRALRIEAETYVGLSISGPEDLVQLVKDLLER